MSLMRCNKTIKNFIALFTLVLFLSVQITPVAHAQTASTSTSSSVNVISSSGQDVDNFEPVNANSLKFNTSSKIVSVSTPEGAQQIAQQNVLILNLDSKNSNSIAVKDAKNNQVIAAPVVTTKIVNTASKGVAPITASLNPNALIVTTQRIKDLAVTTTKLANGSVTTQKLADLAVTMQKIANNAVTTEKIADGSITGDKLADGSISLSKLSGLSITAEQIANYTITAEKLANKSVNSFALDDYSVITSKIGTQAITSDKLSDNSVLVNAIGNGAVTNSKILANAVDGTKIQLGSDALGDIMYYNGTDYVRLPAGTNGQVLGLTGGIPSWGDTTSPISSLTDAITSNAIDNKNFTQIWNWSTATTQNGLELGANALTAGSVLRISSTNASLNSTRGLLDVANTGSSTSGVVARIQSNSTVDSGLTVFADGRVGINTNTPGVTFAVKQNENGNTLINAQRTTDVAPSGDFITYWNAAGDTALFRVDNSGNVYSGGISNSGALTIISTSAPQFRVQYNAGNENTNSVSSTGTTTFGFNGTSPQALFVPQSNGTDTFQFKTAGGLATVLNVDTQNQRVGVGTTTPAATFSVGSTSQFQVDSNGNVIANTINASGTLTLTGLAATSMVFTDASSNLITATMSGDATITTGGVFTISNDAITTGKILDQNVTTSKIADLNVTTGKLADNAVTTAKVADLNITTQKIADSAVTALKLATDAVETVKIKDLNVTTAKIDDLAITAGKLAADSVITAKILDSNVTTAKLADFAVTAIKLATDAVTTIKIQDGAVTTPKIADLNITTQKIANNAVDGTKIQLGSDATGDIMYYNGTDYVRLPVGSPSQVLMVSGGSPVWGAGTSPISALTPAVANNSIDNSIYAQTWNWGGMAAGSALSLGITGTSSADNTALNITTSSTGTNAYALVVNDDGTYSDSTPFMVDKNGNVGIGATTAAQKLTVVGTGSFTGNVGIGTTPDVNIPLLITPTSSSIALRINSAQSAGYISFQESNASRGAFGYLGGSTLFASGEIADGIGLRGETAIQFGIGASLRMTIANSGNIGIGTNSPSALFSVGSSSQFQVNSSGAIAAATGISSSGTINFSGLTASKAVFTDASKNLTSTGTVGVDQGGTGTTGLTGLVIGNGASPMSATTLSSGIATQISDETGSGALVFGTSPVFTTNISTPEIISGSALTLNPAAGQNVNMNLSGTGDFVVNSNQLVVDTSAGNVGIGTASPAYALHIVTNAPGSVPFAIQNTSDTGFASMRYFDDAGVQRMSVGYGNANATATAYREKAYIITYLANPILFVTNGAERMRVTETGTVGIGTQTPGAQLDVKTAASGNIGLIVGGTTGQTGDLQQWKDASGNTKLAVDSVGALYQTPSMVFNTSTLDPNDSTSHLFAIKNSPKIQFDPSAYSASDSFVANQFSPVFDMTGARVSGTNFGYNTLYALYTDPAEDQSMTNMDLRSLYGYVSHAGNVTLGTATGVAGRVNNTGAGTITVARSLWARNVNNTGGGTIGTAYGLYLDNQTAGATNYAIYSAGGQSYFAGNVGVGTATPQAKLEVQNANTTAASGTTTALISTNDSQAGDKGGSLGFGGQVASGVSTTFATIAGRKESSSIGNPSGYLQFSTQSSGGVFNEAMRINSLSNIGIGTLGSGILRRVDIKNASGQTGSLTLMNNDFLLNSTGTSLQFSTGAATGDTYYRMQVNNAGQSNGGNLVINDLGGNVGVGTSTPTTFKLEVAGNIGPSTDNANNLGSAVKRYANVYATTFNGAVTPTGFTQGSVVFAGSGGTLSQNNSAFFWDNTNSRLGIGTTTPITTNGGLDIASGGIGLIVGADASATTRTNTTTKEARIGIPHYTNTEEPLSLLVASSSSSANTIVLGGGTSSMNAATTLLFSTAANTTTTTGSIRMAIDSGGNVGIGTTTPNAKLEVSAPNALGIRSISTTGLGANSGGFFQASSNAMPTAADQRLGGLSIGVYDGTNNLATAGLTAWSSEVFSGSANGTYLRFETTSNGGTARLERMRLTSEGNLGIGTTTPTTGKLQINTGAASNNALTLQATTQTARTYGLGIDSSANFAIYDNTAAATRMVIDSNGQAGFGTTAPSAGIENYGTSQLTAAMTDAGVRGSILALNGNGATAGNGGAITFGNAQSVAAGSLGYAAIKGLVTNGTNNTVGDLAFSTRAAGTDTALTERMRLVGTSGYLALGHSSPSSILDINGALTFRSASVCCATITPAVSVNGTARTLRFEYNSSTANEGFQFYNSNNSTSLVMIQGNGNVGIGTTTPASPLHVEKGVAGNYAAYINNTDNGTSSNGLKVEVANNNANNTVQRWFVAGSEIMRVQADGRVGIGTTSAAAALDVTSGGFSALLEGTNLRFTRNTGPSYIAASQTSGYLAFVTNGRAQSEANSNLTLSANQNSYFNGNLGVGDANPTTAKVSIASNSGNELISLNGTGASNTVLRWRDDGTETGAIYTLNGETTMRVRAAGALYLDGGGVSNGAITVLSTGSVGVGTTSPGTVRLAVNENVDGDGDISLTNANTGASARAIMSFNSDSASGLISATSAAYTGVASWADSMVLQTSAGTSGGMVLYSGSTLRFQNAAGTNAMIVSGGKVGIGTSSPNSKLDVTGVTRMSYDASNYTTFSPQSNGNLFIASTNGGIYASNGTSNNYFFAYDGANNRYSYVSGTGMAVTDGGATKTFFPYTGSSYINNGSGLGIGTTTPAKKLEIVDSGLKISGTNSVDSVPNNARLIVDSGASTGHVLADLRNSNGSTLWVGGSDVGVGTNTPSAKFDVSDVATAQTANRMTVEARNAGSTFNTTAGVLTTWTGYFNNTATRSTGANALTNVGLYATASGAQNNYAAIFDQGSVGIGTTSPSSTNGGLDVSSGGLSLVLGADSGASTRTNLTTKQSSISQYHYTNAEEPMGMLYATSGSTASLLRVGGGISTQNAATQIEFYTAATTTTTSGSLRMNITSGGNVGIGGGITSGSAAAPLEVKNNSATTAGNYLAQFYNTNSTLSSTGGGVNIQIDATTGTGWPLMFSKATGTAMQGVSCNYATNTCSIATPSDVRLKQNINETNYSLESVMNIQVRDYEYTYDSTHTRQTGFLAQQLATVFPDAVYVGSSSASIAAGDLKNTWSVDYTRVVPLLTKAIQDIGNITSTFKTNLIAWLGNVENGITDLYAKTVKGDKVQTKELCIDDICVTRDELMRMKSNQAAADNGNGGGNTGDGSGSNGGGSGGTGDSGADTGDGSGTGTGDTSSGTPNGDGSGSGDTGGQTGGDSGSTGTPSGDTGTGSGDAGSTGGTPSGDGSGSTSGTGSGDAGSGTGSGDAGGTPPLVTP